MPKQDLVFRKPVLNATGSLGFSPGLHSPLDWSAFGAFVTNPISLRPRLPAERPLLAEYSGGVLIHSGMPNPGFRRSLRQFSRKWAQSSLPIVVSLMADRPEETREMVRALEGQDNILAVQLGFAPLLADDIISMSVELSIGELPIIVSLPPDQVLRLGPQIEAMGAAALTISSPRGAVMRNHELISGRLYGPSLFPPTLELVRAASKLGLTIVACGGVCSMSDVESMLAAGAVAVGLDLGLWLPPTNEKSPVN